MIENKKWSCDLCRKVFLEKDLLVAINPFDGNQNIIGCPNCKSVSGFTRTCDEDGCDNEVTCGFSTPEGYRSTCNKHSRLGMF